MNWHLWIRKSHRWVSLLFTVCVLANFGVRGLKSGEPPPWLTYSPLAPLFLLLFTGLYLFAWPYQIRWRGKHRVSQERED